MQLPYAGSAASFTHIPSDVGPLGYQRLSPRCSGPGLLDTRF